MRNTVTSAMDPLGAAPSFLTITDVYSSGVTHPYIVDIVLSGAVPADEGYYEYIHYYDFLYVPYTFTVRINVYYTCHLIDITTIVNAAQYITEQYR